MSSVEVYERLGAHYREDENVDIHVVLNHEQRDKGRLRAISEEGTEVRLFLERGVALSVGELLRSECGKTIMIKGAVEEVVEASCDDWHTFTRACYHLGNRHVKIQIGPRWLRITPDHVLEEMLVQLGLTTASKQAVFVPESGAYAHGHHHH